MNTDVITSASNARLKYIRKLSNNRDTRRADNVYLVEGIRLLLDAPIDDIHSIYISDELYDKINHSSNDNNDYVSKLLQLIDECDSLGIDITIVSADIMNRLSSTVSPQGIMAIIRRKRYDKYDLYNTYLLLEDIQDPGNLGTLFRSAEASGIEMVIMNRGCVDIYNPKTIRATMGTIYRMPYILCQDDDEWIDIISNLLDTGVKIYGGCPDNSTHYADVDMTDRCAIVIGNEGNGISSKTLRLIDKVNIPMEGEIESLNASVAGSILMYEINRQRRT